MRTKYAPLAILALILGLACAVPANAGLNDLLDKAQQSLTTGSSSSSTSASGLSDADVTKGLKEALAKGVTTSVNSLGRTNGYFGNQAVRILLPESVQKVEPALRLAGQGQLVDDLVLTMNRAAEKAVPQVANILGDAVRSMTVSDAKGILSGPSDAATQYFRKTSGRKITEMMQPIISKATDSAGVTKAYKKLLSNPLASGLAQSSGLDLDAYVNEKAQDGLFLLIAKEEQDIRVNPAARTTAILKKVFGSN